MRRFRKEFGLKKARILRERLIPVSQRLKIGIESVRNLVSLEVHASLDKSSICRNLLSILGIFCCRILLLLLV